MSNLPKDVQDYKTLKAGREADAQTFLEKPELAILKHGVKIENKTIQLPAAGDYNVPIRIYSPAKRTNDILPVMLYFHGGYWCSGTVDSEDLGCRAIIARGNNIIIVSFEYRLIPDVDWKTMFADVENAVQWLAAHAAELEGDVSEGFLVGGAEAGAHLAAISAIRARDHHPDIKLTGQCLIVPVTIAWPDKEIPEDWKNRLRSHEANANAPIFNEELYGMLLEALSVPESERRNGDNFPLWADLKGLPPAYLPVDECDPIRDEGFLYAELLAEAGVKTRTDYYRGLPNIFVQFPDLPTTLVAGGHLAGGIAWLLQNRK